jgi:hypothetical protein
LPFEAVANAILHCNTAAIGFVMPENKDLPYPSGQNNKFDFLFQFQNSQSVRPFQHLPVCNSHQ